MAVQNVAEARNNHVHSMRKIVNQLNHLYDIITLALCGNIIVTYYVQSTCIIVDTLWTII